MAAARYRVITFDVDGSIYTSDDILNEPDGLGHLAVSDALHALGGWSREICYCGLGRVYEKEGRERGLHLDLVDEELESLALMVGLLAPQSLNGRLAVTT
jgi:hypothetical protein